MTVTAPACRICVRRGYTSAACAAAVLRAAQPEPNPPEGNPR